MYHNFPNGRADLFSTLAPNTHTHTHTHTHTSLFFLPAHTERPVEEGEDWSTLVLRSLSGAVLHLREKSEALQKYNPPAASQGAGQIWAIHLPAVS